MLVDHTQLKTLKDILGRDTLLRVKGSYEEDSQAKLNALEQAVNASNLEQVEQLSHSLKSASSNLALVSLTRLFAQMEASASQGQAEPLMTLLQNAQAEYPTALAELSTLL
ncbi:Hpt domain-containing protein [Marinomonas fungiae]|uniref:Hpt domain n=1 Tax=Marinomonas fungiae TaxID=1137284 RepID=A0A0K6IKJ2_9GAMM|nr:Hpt domain-containing protein [Marinomonas fungiae]CUB03619.1 Hpt domain [Marinomonas fungiae]